MILSTYLRSETIATKLEGGGVEIIALFSRGIGETKRANDNATRHCSVRPAHFWTLVVITTRQDRSRWQTRDILPGSAATDTNFLSTPRDSGSSEDSR